MKYDVHAYMTVRVKVSGIEAENQVDAIGAALHRIEGTRLFPFTDLGNGIEYDDADEFTGFLVDEEGDHTYERTQSYLADGVTPANLGLS